MIRPAAAAQIARWAELAGAVFMALIGLYLIGLGGYVWIPLGALILAAALPLALLAYRRQQFAQSVHGEGVIEVVEGELRYFSPSAQIVGAATLPAPSAGGFLSLPDLAELRLIHVQNRGYWRLKTFDGQALMVPVDAAGHAALFDVFAALPNIDNAALLAALARPPASGMGTIVLWRRVGP